MRWILGAAVLPICIAATVIAWAGPAAPPALPGAAAGRTPVPPYFYFEADLTDARTVTGTAGPKDIPFEATVADGKTVKINMGSPGGDDPKWAWTIDWQPARKFYVIRCMGWTGEVTKIWDTLELAPAETVVLPASGAVAGAGSAGEKPAAGLAEPAAAKAVLKGDQIKQFRLRYVKVPTAKSKKG